jgi:hypothetical protein
MDIFESEIPNIRIRSIGTILSPLEIVESRIVLEAWDGYFLKHMESGWEITDGKVRLDFGGYNRDVSLDWSAQVNAYRHLMQHQFEIRDNILRALSGEIGSLTRYLDEDDPDVPKITPETAGDFDFRPFLGPLSISFTDEDSKDDVSYLEWHFQCTWDPEHGFAATTHKERVIHIDQETNPWKIYEDNGTLAEKQKEYDERAKNFKPPPQPPWWKFW